MNRIDWNKKMMSRKVLMAFDFFRFTLERIFTRQMKPVFAVIRYSRLSILQETKTPSQREDY
jgi:hypothetical protein